MHDDGVVELLDALELPEGARVDVVVPGDLCGRHCPEAEHRGAAGGRGRRATAGRRRIGGEAGCGRGRRRSAGPEHIQRIPGDGTVRDG
jgi:hypothetical protein